MKKEINVHILASPHPQFDEILDFPPEGIKYDVDRIKSQYHSWFAEKKIVLHNFLLKFLPIPRMTHVKTDADLIHSTRGIIQIAPKKPWILDCESGGVFTSFNYECLNSPLVKGMIHSALNSKRCKKILPQSEAAKQDLLKAIDCSDFMGKIEVLYLAMRPYEKKRPIRKDKKVILSFVGKEFYAKGGQDVLRAYEILIRKYKNLELRFKGDVPEEYKSFLKLPGVSLITGHLPREELFDKMYLNTDIFVLPTTSDNYGVVFLEAMSAGLPLVGSKSFTVPELIEEGKNGFLVDNPYTWENYLLTGKKKGLNNKKYVQDISREHPEVINELVKKLSILIENKILREKMGKESRKMIGDKDGKFSISRRNKQLRKIYEETLMK